MATKMYDIVTKTPVSPYIKKSMLLKPLYAFISIHNILLDQLS